MVAPVRTHGTRRGLLVYAMLLGACGDDDASPSDAGADAGVSARDAADDGSAPDDGSASDAGLSCPDDNCGLDCDPAETTVALTAASAGVPALFAVGDMDPATSEEVGDGLHHLFVGVLHVDRDEPGCDRWDAFTHDAVSSSPEGPYVIAPEPILPLSQLDDYDRCGVETPSYLRADDRTEYIYYCALSAPLLGRIAGLRRRDGGAWEKLGIVAEPLAGQTTQCEPDVVHDLATGLYYLFYQSDFMVGAERKFGLIVRTSDRPDAFDSASDVVYQEYGPEMGFLTRPSLSLDPYDGVWRFAFDANGYAGTPAWPESLIQTWARVPTPSLLALSAHGGILHEPEHGTHPGLHLPGRGNVRINGSALYPDPDRVLFFYAGIVTAPAGGPMTATMQVNAQTCRRRR